MLLSPSLLYHESEPRGALVPRACLPASLGLRRSDCRCSKCGIPAAFVAPYGLACGPDQGSSRRGLEGSRGLCEGCASKGHGVLTSAGKKTLSFNLPLRFEGRRDVLLASSLPTLALLARALRDNPLPVQIEGHTNNGA